MAANGGKLTILVLPEEGGQVSESFLPASIAIGAQVDLFFEINPSKGTVTPAWQVEGGSLQTGPAIALDSGSSILSAIRGTYQNGSEPSALAVGVIATHGNTGKPFSAQYDHINVYAGSLADQAATSVVLAESSTKSLLFDASDTFIYDDEVSYSEVAKFDADKPLPPGIVKMEALPPGLEKKSVLSSGLQKNEDVDLPSSAGAITDLHEGTQAFATEAGWA